MKYAAAITNFIAFELAWLAAVWGGAAGWPWLGSVPALLVAVLHLALSRGQRLREGLLIAAITVLGFALESGFMAAGLIDYAGTEPGQIAAPVWIMALWFGFATLPNASLSWLRGRWGLQFMLGAIAGPLTYWGGVKLGAATIPDGTGALFWIGLAWALTMPVIFLLADAISPRR
ncbi:DUF2878 domain-containing protein [Aestuariivirga sp.]|uniref:DUF2878 domain-containing protein n=1 Tax=Aestuariivirga sp. TaxID=2650926 RepID=UPI003593841B